MYSIDLCITNAYSLESIVSFNHFCRFRIFSYTITYCKVRVWKETLAPKKNLKINKADMGNNTKIADNKIFVIYIM